MTPTESRHSYTLPKLHRIFPEGNPRYPHEHILFRYTQLPLTLCERCVEWVLKPLQGFEATHDVVRVYVSDTTQILFKNSHIQYMNAKLQGVDAAWRLRSHLRINLRSREARKWGKGHLFVFRKLELADLVAGTL